MIDQDELKKQAGLQAATHVEDGMVLGLGTGSTVKHTIIEVGRLVRDEGLSVRAIPTSQSTTDLAMEAGIPLVDFSEVTVVDLSIDGADEVDSAFNLIKGGGSALTREKIVARASLRALIVVDESKRKEQLGAFPLPVEVLPFGWQATARYLEDLGCQPKLRRQGDKALVTENGNYILDAHFGTISNPTETCDQIRALVGVVECGLFVGLTDLLIVATQQGVEEIEVE